MARKCPVVVEPAAEPGASHPEHGVGASHRPAHAARFMRRQHGDQPALLEQPARLLRPPLRDPRVPVAARAAAHKDSAAWRSPRFERRSETTPRTAAAGSSRPRSSAPTQLAHLPRHRLHKRRPLLVQRRRSFPCAFFVPIVDSSRRHRGPPCPCVPQKTQEQVARVGLPIPPPSANATNTHRSVHLPRPVVLPRSPSPTTPHVNMVRCPR